MTSPPDLGYRLTAVPAPHLCMVTLRRYLSYLWPQPIRRVEGRHGPLTVRWEGGRKVVNSLHGNQSFGALHRVWRLTFDQLGLRQRPPRSILLLGLGAGSAPTILRDELACTAPITAVEWDPVMAQIARTEFTLDRHAHLDLVLGDATVQVHAMRGRYDLVLVDLFADLELARGVDSRAFVQGLRERCEASGTVCFNTVSHDQASDARCRAVQQHLGRYFGNVRELRLEVINRMFIAS